MMTKASAVAITFALTVGVVAACDGGSSTNKSESDDSSKSTSVDPDLPTVNVHGVFNYNLGDKQAVAGRAQVVFLGEVVEQTGSEPRTHLPQSQFLVRVLESLKGDRSGVITINQQGGHRPSGQLVLVEKDPLLVPGGVYILAAKYSQKNKWYTVIPRGGTIRVDQNVETAAKRSGADSTAVSNRLAEWVDAVQNEKPRGNSRVDPLPAPGADAPTSKEEKTTTTPPPQSSADTSESPDPTPPSN